MTEFNGANTGGNTAGTSGADLILSAGGNDSVAAGAGNDAVYSGTGNDSMNGGSGNDIVAGGAGNDVVSGGTGNDIVAGGAGDDVLTGGEGADILSGGSGKDTFQVQAASGDDIIVDFQFGFDKINFYAGAFANLTKNLTISTFADLQKMITDFTMAVQNMGQDAAKIQLDGDQSITFLNVGSLFGFPADTNPNSAGSSLNNLIFGSEADGGSLNGGAGEDTILGGEGSSVFRGDNDNDTLMGGMGDDTIGAHSGNDVLFGNAGNDILSGNVGNDTLTGDDGADVFRFGVGVGHDVVTDLNFAEGDYLFFVAHAISNVNITVDSVEDLQIFASNADSTAVNGGNLVITYGANSVTLAEWGDLSFAA